MASQIICKYKLCCKRQFIGHLKSSQRTRALSKKRKHKCGERTCPYLSMSVITCLVLIWQNPVSSFEEWASVSFDFNYNFMFARRRVLRKVLWKPANALVAANECLKSLGLKYLVQTRNVFVVACLKGFLSESVHISLMP